MAFFPIVLPVVFPFSLSSTDPDCNVESARKLADRINEVRQQMALLLGLPLDTPVTAALNFGAGLMGTRNQDSRYVDNTHYTLDADQVMTKSLAPGFLVWDNPAVITNDIGLGGPLPNTRDQAGVFPANAFVHLYWITNGTLLASLSSLAAPYPGPGPVLPPGYVLGAYAGATLLDGSGFFVPSNIRGRWTVYKAARQVFTLAAPGALLPVTCSSCVPPNADAIRAQMEIAMSGSISGGNGTFSKVATLFDGLDDEAGSASVTASRATGVQVYTSTGFLVAEAPQYGQILKVTIPTPQSTEVETVTVKVIGFRNANGG